MFKFPRKLVAEATFNVLEYLAKDHNFETVKEVRLVNSDFETHDCFQALFDILFNQPAEV